jgi:hypothetical protein
VPPGRTTHSPDPKGCLGEVSTRATGAETRLAATRSHEGTPRPGLGKGNCLTFGPDSEAEASDQSKKGRDTRCQRISDSSPKIRGQNISLCNLQNSGGQPCSTLPPRQTSASSLSSTYPKFSNPSTTFDRVALHPPNLGFRGPRPGTRLPAHPGPSRALGPARAHPAPSQHSSLTDCPDSDSALPQATIQLSPIGTSCQLRLPPSSSR